MRMPTYQTRERGNLLDIITGNGTFTIDLEDRALVLAEGHPELAAGYPRVRRQESPATYVSVARLVLHAGPGDRVHFRNADKKNCSKSNLMLVPRGTKNPMSVVKAQRTMLRSARYVGVYYHTDREPLGTPWSAARRCDGETIVINYHATEELAAAEYDRYLTGAGLPRTF